MGKLKRHQKPILKSKALIPRALSFGWKEKLPGSAKIKGKIIHGMLTSFLLYQKEISKNGFTTGYKILKNEFKLLFLK